MDPAAKNTTQAHDLIAFTSDIVAAYVTHNALSPADLPKLLTDVHAALTAMRAAPATAAVEDPQPAVSVRRSITPDHLVCLEDGKQFKTLKRHLMTDHGLTPQEYRERWGLPGDYPMVAPNYSASRSSLAKSAGLGRKAGLAHGKPPAASTPKKAAKRPAATAKAKRTKS